MLTTSLLLASLLLLGGCAAGLDAFGERLKGAVLDHDDPALVAQAAPAYLLLADGLVADDPDNPRLLLAAAALYRAYAGAFVEDAARAGRLTERARRYAERALCRQRAEGCDLALRPFDEFRARLATFERDDVASLYGYGAGWAAWVQARRNDWNAVADIPKIEALMQQVVALDDAHDRGGAHVYLGVLASLLPPAAGGRPEQARRHFERAIALSDGRNLMAKVLYAEYHARAALDRALHDRLLDEVLAADPHAPGFTLTNTLAQRRAAQLRAEAERYFE